MELRLTVIAEAAAARFQLSGPAGASGEEIAGMLAEELGRAESWTVAGRPLEELVLGTRPLVGDVVLEARGDPSRILDGARQGDLGESGDPNPPLQLTVLEGPSCGRGWPVPRGRWSLGKDGADLVVADDALAPFSAVLEVGPDAALLRPVDGKPVACLLGTPLRLGDTVLRLDAGTPSHCRPPGPLPDPETVQLVPPGTGWKTLLITAGLPVAAGALVAWMFSWWMILVFSAMSALMAVAHWCARGSSTARNRRLVAEAGARECGSLDDAAPPLGVLWARPSGVPAASAGNHEVPIRWGRGTRTPHVRLRGEASGAVQEMTDAPVVTDARWPHLLSVPGHVVDAVLSRLLLRGTPVAIRPVGSNRLVSPEWLAYPRVALLDPGDEAPAGTIVLQDGGAVPTRPAGRTVYLMRGKLPDATPGSRNPCVRVEHAGGRLRIETAGVAEAGAEAPGLRDGAPAVDVVPEGLAPGCRRTLLAAAADSAGARPGAGAAFSSLTDLAAEDAEGRWRRTARSDSLLADLGTDPLTGESVVVDLVRDGPHCVVGGTTGSGKSEFLRSMLLSLALSYGPERLGMVLIDFKGGANFGPLSHLPHVHRLITDLDDAAVHRDLAYLQAELVRREKLFRRCGAADWHEYQQRRATGTSGEESEPVPQLVICVDEFRMLVETLPEAMSRLLRIATVGRSLGIHLVLSTQRPQGAISPDIRANVSITVCLRVASEADSTSLLGSARAARVPVSARGRGFLLRDGVLQEFQGRLADGLPKRESTALALRILPAPGIAGGSGRERAEFSGPVADPNRLEQDLTAWPKNLGRWSRVRAVIPPELEPGRTPEATVPAATEGACGTVVLRGADLVLGAAECPVAGWQGPLRWSPEAHGPLAVIGSLADQRLWAEHLLRLARAQDLSVLAVVSDRGCAEAMRRHGGSRVVGVLSTDDPEFLLDGLQAAREGAGWAERLLVLVQGADRAVEELMRCGLAGEQILEDFVVSVGRRWTVSVTAGTALPRSLRGLCSTTACWGSSARSDYALAHPRTGRELAPHLALLEGSMVPVPGPCGLLVADTTTSRNEAETRRPRPRALKPFPARLMWSVPSSEDELAPASGGAAGSWPLLLGAQAPFLEECVLPLAPGEIVGVAADAADGTRFLEALRIFNPWADFLVRGAAAPPSNRRGDEAADRPRIAILSAAHDLLASDHAAADAFLRAADAAILVFDPQRFLPSRTPWAADLRTAGHGVVLGPRLGIEGSFRAEECPKSIGTPAEGTGILLSRAGRKRFMIAVPGEDRGTDPSHAAAWPPDAGTNHRDGIRR